MTPETKVALRKMIDEVVSDLIQRKTLPKGVKYSWAGKSVILLTGSGDLEKLYGRYPAYMAMGAVAKHEFMEALNRKFKGWSLDIGAQKFSVNLSTPMLNWLAAQERPPSDFRAETMTRISGNVYNYAKYIKSVMDRTNPFDLEYLQVDESPIAPITPQLVGKLKDRRGYTHFGPYNSLEEAWDHGKTINRDGGPLFKGLIEMYQGKYYVCNPEYRGS